jgi:hypothetical protein
MNNSAQEYIRIAKYILIVLALTVAGAIGFSIYDPFFLSLPFIGGVSTLFITVLTVLYVITTSQQFSVIESQLEEMRRGRELQAQPLPIIQVDKVYIEAPTLFSVPPFDGRWVMSRNHAEYHLYNQGGHPAVNPAVSGKLVMSRGNKFESIHDPIDVLAEGEEKSEES